MEIETFNAFWKPRKYFMPVTDFNELSPSYGLFYRAESTKIGNLWFVPTANAMSSNPYFDSVLIEVLEGRPIVEEKISHYLKEFLDFENIDD